MDRVFVASEASTNPIVMERRRFPRVVANRIGTIELATGEVEKCMISNLSVGGAKIYRYFIDELPEVFELRIDEDLAVHARVVWKHENTFGLRFLP